ncbi:MAG: metallophosphoesterase family protein, partial [Saprospiraceae bacterium]|nr:metallophosphoesterase family protein [Saprospiraceae bacterium]
MKKLRLLTLLCCLFMFNQAFGQTVLVDYSSVWSYYDNANQPSNNGGFDWNDINYNASSWNQGSAQLGYGDSDENTVINSNTKTAYFRHSFTVTDPSSYDGVDLNLIYDDGAVVYLNGTEVWRVNMPSGTISYSTFASTSSSDNDIAITSISNLLVTGENVLAVEVHQVSNSSSDISFDFKATASIPGAVNITRGPYLQKASASSMTVRWRTASSTQSIVKYGTNINNLNQTYSNTTPKTEHIAEINGLAPNTKYFYRIENSAAVLLPESTDIYFKTHPTIGSEQPITMWILGDCGTANNDQRDVRDAYYNYIGNNHTDGILFLGDNAYNDGTDAQYQNAIFSNMYESKLQNSVAWSCLGNHDGYTANSSSQSGPYYDIFSFPTAGESGGVPSGTEAYYSFDYGNIHFIALESYETDRSVGGAMYNWALNDIQNTTQDWIVAYWHHPPYTKGSHDSDSESNLIDMRQNFLPMLENNGVDLVLSGHSHSYERSYFLNGHYGNANTFNSSTHTVGTNGAGDGKSDGNGVYDKTVTGPEAGDGAVYITTGSSGKISGGSLNHQAMFYSVSQLGSCVLEVNGNQLDVKFVRETGSIDDYFTILKEEECVVGTSCDDGDPCT